jgi:IclR family acetate operon transcriptional repressor
MAANVAPVPKSHRGRTKWTVSDDCHPRYRSSPMKASDSLPMSLSAASTSSAERSLRLLSILADQGRPMSLAELVEALGLPKATVHRMCVQLMECGFMARDVNERDFVVGISLRKLALDTLNHGSLRGLRHDVLAGLVAQVGETCNFTTLDGAGVLYLDRVEAPWPWRLTLDVGAHVPLHCTASGKLFLAFMSEAQREAMFRTLPLQPITQHSITTVEALRQACTVIRNQGYAFDQEEFVLGLVAIAVPVRDTVGEVRAALAVHGPAARLPLEQALLRLPALHEAAERMTLLL